MAKALSVRLKGEEVGILRLVNGKMEFIYNPNAKHPLSMSLPIQQGPHKEKLCRAFFGGLLPENPNMRDLLAKKYKININDDFKLLEAIGRDCAGAISFHPIEEKITGESFYELQGTILSDKQLKQHIEELPYKPYLGNRLSLAGAQEKTAVCLIDGKIALPIDDSPTTHILKTSLPKYIQTIQNEYICMKAATEIGIETANVEIRNVDGLEFLLVERFDRCTVQNDDKFVIERLLQEDFAQALGVQSRDKYNVTFKDCVKVLNYTSSPAIAKSEFVKRVIFNYLIGNADAHSKNFSIYWKTEDNISLTPAYDILCSTIYDCDQRIAMKIGKAKFYNDVTDKDWEIFAKELDVSYKFVNLELIRQKKLLPSIVEKISNTLDCEVGKLILNEVNKRCL